MYCVRTQERDRETALDTLDTHSQHGEDNREPQERDGYEESRGGHTESRGGHTQRAGVEDTETETETETETDADADGRRL